MAGKTPQERLEMGFSMFTFAKALIRSSLEQKGDMPRGILRQQLFLRLYGDEFDDMEKNKILEHLGNLAERQLDKGSGRF